MTSNKQEQNIKHEILTPIEPMLAVYAAGEEVYQDVINRHNGSTCAELKYDGYRMQLHKKGEAVKGFTRSLKGAPFRIYPELMESIAKLPDCVLDCELNGGTGHSGFKVVKNRFRSKETSMEKYTEKADISRKLELRVFDVLCLENKWTMHLPLTERRKFTENISRKRIKPGKQWKVESAEGLEKLFTELVDKKNEGLVCKNPSSLYIPGDKSGEWLKIKKFEPIDVVILGVYMKNESISQLLCGTYNPEAKCFETIAKVNAKKDGMNVQLEALLKDKFKAEKPSSILLSANAKEDDLPDFYIEPMNSAVVEIKAMNINYGKNRYSCGLNNGKSYSLRIAWLNEIRDDKTPTQTSAVKDIEYLYKVQEGLI
jgi:DNA ligase-1